MYDTDNSVLSAALTAANSTIFTQDTINQILALATKGDTKVTINTASPDASGVVTVAAGTEMVYVTSSDTQQTTLTPPANAPVVIFQGKGGVVATLNDASATVPSANQTAVDRIVIGSAGNDRIVVADARNTQVILGTGDSTVMTGAGVDTVVAGLGNSTIVGGIGDYAVVRLGGSATNYTVTAANGHAVVTNNSTNKVTDISKIQYTLLDSGQALVFAKNSVEAQISTLYHTAFGRDPEAGGLDYWFDLARAGASMKQISDAFTHSMEFAPHAAIDNSTFVQQLYQNTFGRAGEDAGVSYWLDALAHGSSRADLILQFSQIAANNIAGAIHTEPQVIGSVSIVTGII